MNRNPVLTASLVEGRACRPFVQAEMFYEWLVDLSWLASAASSKQRRRKPTSSQSPYPRSEEFSKDVWKKSKFLNQDFS